MPPQAKKVELKSTRMEEGDDVHLDGEWLHSPTQKKKHPASVMDLGRTQSEKKQKTAGDALPAVSNVPQRL
jgi:hypothetical protein